MYIQICKKKMHWIKSFFKINVMYIIIINQGVTIVELKLWCLTPLSTILQLYRGGWFYWRKPEYLEKNHWPTASHWQTLLHNVVLSTTGMKGIRTRNPVVAIGIDCIGSNNSNYYTITTTMAPQYCWEKFRPCIHFINEHTYL
jgi:hypothetical protein